ncbi:MAG: hypothetical protein RIQ56_887 [Candidatus Parcubacteria bacterium]|jgi:endonuclease-3
MRSEAREVRAQRIVSYLKRAYPFPKSELLYSTPFQFLVAVMLSAQCTDKLVNKVTRSLFKQLRTARDFAKADPRNFEKQIAQVSFFRTKARNIQASAKIVADNFGGKIPHEESKLVTLPGVGYKTAHVVAGELFGHWEGIPTDTHVKRFAKRFDLTDHEDLKKISKDLEALVPKKDWKYVNNGLVLYGRYLCPARPHDCKNHPLTKLWKPALHRWPKTREVR